MKKKVIQKLEQRGISIIDLAFIVLELQKPFDKDLTVEECLFSVDKVLAKREVQYIVLTAIALDILAEKKLMDEPIQQIIERDEPLYGVDETLAMGIASIYGSIGYTSFGYLDKAKPGIIKVLDNHSEGSVHTFLDDIVAAIAAAAAARLAHTKIEIDPGDEPLPGREQSI